MDANLKVTTDQQESNYADIFGGDTSVVIPLFQRKYRWKKDNLDHLLRDICEVRDQERESYFLGIVVSVQHTTQLGRPGFHEIVDGQQRLTSLYLLLLATASIHCDELRFLQAADLIQTYLLRRRFQASPVNTKLVPSYSDRAQFRRCWDSVLVPKLTSLDTMEANPAILPQSAGEASGALWSQFRYAKSKLRELTCGDPQKLNQLVDIIALRLSFVGIALKDGSAASLIFERLNNRAEPVTGADLVRNEVFARGAVDPENARRVFEEDWHPFQERLAQAGGDGLERLLFPYALTKVPSVKKGNAFTQLRTVWDGLEPQAIIRDIDQYSNTFLALETGRIAGISPDIDECLRRLHSVGKPRSIYPFVFLCIADVARSTRPVGVVVDVLSRVESFLFRRAICGIEPTGLHAVFKSLHKDCCDAPPDDFAQVVEQTIRSKPTVQWPGDSEFAEKVKTSNLYGRSIKKHAILEYERTLGESNPDLQDVEHVCPVEFAAVPEWLRDFSDCPPGLINTWANLLPLSEPMNRSLQNAPFEQKRSRYSNAMYASARELAREFGTWTPSVIAVRADHLARWALVRWPH